MTIPAEPTVPPSTATQRASHRDLDACPSPAPGPGALGPLFSACGAAVLVGIVAVLAAGEWLLLSLPEWAWTDPGALREGASAASRLALAGTMPAMFAAGLLVMRRARPPATGLAVAGSAASLALGLLVFRVPEPLGLPGDGTLRLSACVLAHALVFAAAWALSGRGAGRGVGSRPTAGGAALLALAAGLAAAASAC
ncbi:MAG: hypothetical protein Q4E05_01235 [Pseudoclavibacter sp.]|nr:hypothetical protein [Pseudoclavibacter sp.]